MNSSTCLVVGVQTEHRLELLVVQLVAGGHRSAAPGEHPAGVFKSQVSAAPSPLQASSRFVSWDEHGAEGCDMASAGLGCEWSNLCLQKAGTVSPGFLGLCFQLG